VQGGLQLFDFLQFIKAAQRKQVSDLFDEFDRIGNTFRPKGIPYGINLIADFSMSMPDLSD
jgi:hypothetical protein